MVVRIGRLFLLLYCLISAPLNVITTWKLSCIPRTPMSCSWVVADFPIRTSSICRLMAEPAGLWPPTAFMRTNTPPDSTPVEVSCFGGTMVESIAQPTQHQVQLLG